MSDRDQEIARIAQEEVYPERHNRVFVEWPSERTKEIHMEIATARYESRQQQEQEQQVETPRPANPVITPAKAKRTRSAPKKSNVSREDNE